MKKLISIVAGAFFTLTAIAQPKLSTNNVEEVLQAMTLEEKATLLVGGNSSESAVPGVAGVTRSIDRLGIPTTILADGPAGLRISPKRNNSDKTYYCTGFPVGTVLASMWNPSLVTVLTQAMGEEVKEYGVDVLLAPGVNLHRNPLCGRNFEYFSEDPLLCGLTAAAYIKGIQSNGVGVSIKHFATNNQEINRSQCDSRVNIRPLRELYLKGFELAIRESQPWTVMSSYNRLNCPFTQQNHDLLTTILRDEWAFSGIVMTDWGCKEGTVNAVKAGNDLMEPGNQVEIDRIIDGVRNGTIPIEDVDRNVRRMLEYIVKTPHFKGYKYSEKPDLESHAVLVRQAAPEGMVLLENKGLLPFEGINKIALYGVGAYHFLAGGTGSGNVNKAWVRNISEGLLANGLNVDSDIREWYESYIAYQATEIKVNKAYYDSIGEAVIPELAISKEFMEKKVQETDAAIFVISRNAGEGADRRASEGDWLLTETERGLLQNLADVYHLAGKKIAVVLNVGGVVETSSWKHIPDAVLLAWTPGQEGGLAVADVLCGAVNPSGKLPMTFPSGYFDIPSSYNFPYNYDYNAKKGTEPRKNIDFTNYSEGIWVGYRYFCTSGTPVSYPFGYGLSYTQFKYSKPSVKVSKDGTVTASITVTNIGKVSGKEVVEMYISAPDGGMEKPLYELKGFAKTGNLTPGDNEIVTVVIEPYTLASFNDKTSAWETAAGSYTLHFGASSADIRCSLPFKLSKALSWPVQPVLLPPTPINEMTSLSF